MSYTKTLFLSTFMGIILIYLYFLGLDKTINLIKEEYLFIFICLLLSFSFLYFKVKLKNYEIIDFNKNTKITFKQTLVFFLFFQIIDYISEDGFIGMISQWFLYWIMGLIALLLIENINYYKNYKLLT